MLPQPVISFSTKTYIFVRRMKMTILKSPHIKILCSTRNKQTKKIFYLILKTIYHIGYLLTTENLKTLVSCTMCSTKVYSIIYAMQDQNMRRAIFFKQKYIIYISVLCHLINNQKLYRIFVL